jgi:predicted outer membrane repeat protein
MGDTDWGDRDWTANVTILSGDVGTAGDPYDNSYHVFYHPAELALDASAVLDGFTVTGGYANGSGELSEGGGMHNKGCSPTVAHCTLTGNHAKVGGGMRNHSSSSPSVTDCTFSANTAGDDGGGMANYDASPVVSGCTFSENLVTQYHGGGMFNDHSSPSITNCTFAGNEAPNGAGIYSTESWPTLVNCTFTGNSGAKGAGLMNYDNVVAVVTNCTFFGNSASVYGGAIFNGGNVPSTLDATNCILWGDSPNEIVYSQGSTQHVTYSDVQGSAVYPGIGNIKVDPLFQDPAIGDLHLRPESPCIDQGSNSAPSLPAFDFEGDPRIVDGDGDGTATADMGVDEAPGITQRLYLPLVIRHAP